MYYHGIVAVGLMEGRLVLVDLNMDEGESQETAPAGLYFINPNTRDVSRYRRKALDAGTHLAMEIDSHNVSGDSFVWNGVTFNSDNVQVLNYRFISMLYQKYRISY